MACLQCQQAGYEGNSFPLCPQSQCPPRPPSFSPNVHTHPTQQSGPSPKRHCHAANGRTTEDTVPPSSQRCFTCLPPLFQTVGPRKYSQDAKRFVNPPDVIAFFPLHMLPSYVLTVAASISPVAHHQSLGQPGALLLRFQNPAIASVLYGLRMSSSAGALVFSCGLGSKDADWEKQQNLPPRATLSQRRLHFPGPPQLSQANVHGQRNSENGVRKGRGW